MFNPSAQSDETKLKSVELWDGKWGCANSARGCCQCTLHAISLFAFYLTRKTMEENKGLGW